MSIDVRARALDLPLLRTFRTSRDAKDTASNVLVEIESGGVVGRGEGAPIPRYGQSQASSIEAIEAFVPPADDPFDQVAWIGAFDRAFPGQTAARCALEVALWDWAGRRLQRSLASLLSVDLGAPIPASSWTISIDEPDAIADRVREASGWPVLKLKLSGGPNDVRAIETLRAFTDRPFRVDANEAWDPDEAREWAPWLHALGCEFIEQPFPAGSFDATAALRQVSPIPIVADEDVVSGAALDDLARAYDGINVKLTRLGGIREAVRWIHAARETGLDVLVGCFVESSLGISAATPLAVLARWVDLDGAALLAEDPYRGTSVVDGHVQPVEGPGVGAEPAG